MIDGDSQVMTQIPALLKYIDRKYDMGMSGGTTNLGQYEIDNLLSFVNSDLHTSFGPAF